jgi:hypothetical protein
MGPEHPWIDLDLSQEAHLILVELELYGTTEHGRHPHRRI